MSEFTTDFAVANKSNLNFEFVTDFSVANFNILLKCFDGFFVKVFATDFSVANFNTLSTLMGFFG